MRLRLQPHPVGVQIVMHDGQCTSAAAADAAVAATTATATAATATATTAATTATANAAAERMPAGEKVVLRLVLAEGLKHAFALRPWQVSWSVKLASKLESRFVGKLVTTPSRSVPGSRCRGNQPPQRSTYARAAPRRPRHRWCHRHRCRCWRRCR